jgi:hypothetical protein
MRVFDDIIDTLSDGQYHSFEDIKLAASRNLNETQVEVALGFLQEYGLVKCLRQPGTMTRLRKVQLTTTVLILLRRLKELEGVDVKEAKTQ